MSKTVDQRVVEMRFDNKQFESGVATTTESLNKLKKSLDLSGASKGLEEVNSAAKRTDLTPLGRGVDAIQTKFSALQVMAVTALANITNSAVNAGKRIASALTIDPIRSGFSEYETQINAVQTILANTESKGKTLSDVNSALDELNAYADKTIYNFTEMTRNIGTFTAAGVDLDTSVSAIKGIANLAAVSGSTSQQASTAMYQLSQALASGTVKLMDWNSVVNAGMGGQVFQDALKDTARVHGIAIDDMIAKEGSFRETLSNGWLSSEILTETLAKFTGDLSEEQLKSMGYTDEQVKSIMKLGQTANDAATKVKTFTQLFDTLKEAAQSGWTQTWEILVGDFEEAKELLTSVSDTIGAMIGDSAEARNELLENWKVLGGREDLIESFKNIFQGLTDVIKPIKEAFRDIFPPITTKQLVAFTEGLKNLTSKFKLSDETSENLKRTFRGLFATIDIGKQLFVAVVKAVATLFKGVGKLGGGILEITGDFGDWLVRLSEFIRSSDIFNTVLQGAATIIGLFAEGLGAVLGYLKQKFISPGLEFLGNLLDSLRDKMTGVGDTAGNMRDAVTGAFSKMGEAIKGSTIFKLFDSLWKGIKIVAKGIIDVAVYLTNALVDVLGGNSLLDTLVTGGLGLFFAKLLKGISDLIGNFGSIFEEAGGFLSGVKGILDDVRGCLQAYQDQIKAETIKKIAVAIAILAASLLVLSFIDEDKLMSAIMAITVLFTELMTAMKILTSFGSDIKNVIRTTIIMTGMSTAVLLLAGALRTIASLELEELIVGLLGVAGLMTVIVAAAKIMAKGEKTIVKGATQMVIMAAAVKILASACKDLSSLDFVEMSKGLLGVGALLAGIVLFTKNASFNSKSISTGLGIVLLASSIKILASACADFARMQFGDLVKSLAAIGVLLAELVLFTKLTGNAERVKSTGLAMIALAAAMKIFASAIGDISRLSWSGIAKGLISMAAALAAVTIAVNLMPKGMLLKAAGMIGIATAITILAGALKMLGNMSWSEVAKGLVALGGALGILAVGLIAMKGSIVGAASLVVAVAALSLLVPVLLILGSMSWGSIAKGLVAIAGALTLVAVAGYLAGSVSWAILAMGAAIALIGVGITAAGIGLTALAAGLTAFVASLSTCLGMIVELIPAIIVGIIEAIEKIIVAFCDAIANSAKSIGKALVALVKTICEVLIECAPVIVDTILKLVVGLLEALVDYTPKIVDALFDFILAVIDGIADNLPDLIKAGVKLLMSFFEGVIDAIGDLDAGTIMEGLKIVGMLALVVGALGAIAPLIPLAMVGVIGAGVVIAELAIVLAALGKMASTFSSLTALVNKSAPLLESVGNAIGSLIGGFVGGLAESLTSRLPQIATNLSQFMTNLQPFIDGASRLDSSILKGVAALAGAVVLLSGANLVESITSFITGGSSLSDFGKELAEFGPYMKTYADSVAGLDTSAVEASATAAKALAKMADTIPNSGGMAAWFAGENSVSKFGSELPKLGEGLKGFSDATAGIVPENIVAAANAAKALAEMANIVPNEGGMASWFKGDNSLSEFSDDIVDLGEGLKGFSDATAGLVPENIVAASNAAKALAQMANTIPNQGGMAAWFAGDNSIADFGDDLPKLGKGLKGFSDATAGIVPENIIAASNAAKALAQMADTIPNQGGMVAWFTGDNSIATFGAELPILGMGLKGFSDSVRGIMPENVAAATSAAKALAEMADTIPNQGGMVAWFTGDNSIASFGAELPILGMGLKRFSDSVLGINPESVTAATNAAKSLAEMADTIPNEGGIKAWFSGESSIVSFGSQLPILGMGLKGFSDSVLGINPESVTAAANAAKGLADLVSVIPNEGGVKSWFAGEASISKFGAELPALGTGFKAFSDSLTGLIPENVTAAANAGKSLADLVAVVPNEGGIKSWFSGESGISKFAGNLPKLGRGIKGFSDSVAGIVPENVVAAANAAKALADMTEKIPKEGGIKAWFTGESNISTWAGKLPGLGAGLKGFSDSVAGIVPENVTAAANAAKALAEMTEYLPEDFSRYSEFGDILPAFGDDLKSYFSKTADISTASINSSEKALKAIKDISEISAGNIEAVAKALKNLTKAVSEMAEEIGPELEDAGKEAIEAFVDGIDASLEDAVAAFENVIDSCADAASSLSDDFETAGANLVAGFASGISSNSYKAEAKARAMAAAAAAAAKKELDEHSPSKVFYSIGDYAGLGFVNGLDSYTSKSRKAGASMAESAKNGLSDAISRISDVIDSDMDMQPTIRPVLDLSDVRSGANSIGSMLGAGSSIGVLSNISAIGTMMSRRNQNGSNELLASEINKLRSDLGRVGNTNYNINGLTYDGGSDVAEAIETIVRALRIDRRM